MKWAPLAALGLAACIQSGTVVCDDGRVCPAGLVCDDTHQLCVRPDQYSACDGAADFTACTAAGVADATCYDGVCLPGGCGNQIEDPLEQCDDGNSASGDGCSADCGSDETCDNGITDVVNLEECDDGNPVGHDGCAGACVDESPRWLAVQAQPISRELPGMAYDLRRHRVVMFGGAHREGLVTSPHRIGDTWEWDGQHWFEMAPLVAPSPRTGHSMAYDPQRGVTVLFGGDDIGTFGDTWEWDGGSWTLVDPQGPAPPPRLNAGMAYDAGRGRIVLVGGDVQEGTWEWDGTSWSTTSGAVEPPAGRTELAYDPGRGVLVAFVEGETWERRGTAWSDVTPAAGSPPPIDAGSMAYDTVNGEVVLLSGDPARGITWSWNGGSWRIADDTGPGPNWHTLVTDVSRGRIVLFGDDDTRDTWEWDGATWQRYGEQAGPSPRFGSAAALDVHGDVIVYGGGDRAFSMYEDTWAWSGRWDQREPSSPPGPRMGAAMAYDAARGMTVMYGGADVEGTWLWDGSAWSSPATATSPGLVTGGAADYDAAHEQVVMFALDKTWVWNGTDWSDVTPSGGPSPRTEPCMGYDPLRARIVMFGGATDGDVPTAETWEWDGSTWTDRTLLSSPPTRYGCALAWDAARARIVMFGGQASYNAARNDTWEWDGAHWVPGTAPLPPETRTEHLLFASPDGAGVMLLGGAVIGGELSGGVVEELDDLWRLRWDGGHPDETCVPDDIDGDGRAACDDPDCWVPCAACGDGVCDARESCFLCPEDCGACAVRCGDFACEAGETAATCPGDC